ncbi:MAG: toxin-antitoxin system YwqK family antitoxin [Bacteroidota bacterium]
MRKFIFFISAILLGSLLQAQEKDIDPNGYNVFYYPNGQKSSEGYMEDGQPEGYWKNYFPNGQLRSEGKRTNHKLDSIWRFYNENGFLTKKIHYKAGEKHGYTFNYKIIEPGDSSKSVLISKELYYEGKQNGLSTYYDKKTGNVKYTYQYKDGKKHGLGKQYNKAGEVNTLYEYFNGFLVESNMVNRKNRDDEKTGMWVDFYDSGQLRTESYYVNGKLHGTYREYDRAGNIVKEQQYRLGEPVRAEEEAIKLKAEMKRSYYDNGKLKYEGAFIDSIPVGMHKTFSKNGELKEALEYDDQGQLEGTGLTNNKGAKDSVWTFYFPGGEPRAKGAFKNGVRHGTWKFFFIDGDVEQIGEYKNGKAEDEWKWFYPDGKLLRLENYHKGKREGEFIELSPEGDTIQRGDYFDGEKNGEWFYNVGDQTEIGEYDLGLKNGVWKHYYKGEILIFEGRYINNEPDGLHQHWYINGKPEIHGKYIMGVKDGIWQKYHMDGSLFMIYKYDKGKLIKINGKRWDKWNEQFENMPE